MTRIKKRLAHTGRVPGRPLGKAFRQTLTAIGIVLVIGIIGAIAWHGSHAATATISGEPENSTVALPAQVTTDTTASGGKAVRFSAAAASLPWLSGVQEGNQDAWSLYRGRPVTVVTTWEDDGGWGGTENVWALYTGALNSFTGKLSVAIPMLSNSSDTFDACANGTYNSHFTALGNTLKKYNRADSFVRLGWEGNGTWYAWSVGSNPTGWINCFRQEVTALRAADPSVRIDWNMNKDAAINAATMYPGDSYVDVVGVDFYDMYPHYNDQAAWDADYASLRNGGPHGLGSWLAFAKSHGKKLSVPEWGVNNGGGDGGTDNPFYIQKMYQFYTANASDIAYETYFNTQCPNFCLSPAGKNPLASAAYSSLYKQ